MKHIAAIAALAAAVVFSAPANAAVIGLQAEGGGGPKPVYQLGNGNFLGLWGFDNRERANPGAGAVTISMASDIISGFAGGASRVVGLYNGSNPVNAGASEFDPLTYGFTIDDDARLFGSLWIEWTGGTLVFRQPSGRSTTSMAAVATLEGDPLAITPVPLPAALPLLLAGLGAIGLVARRRKAA